MSIRRSNQLSYNPKKRKVNKGSGPPSGKPSMHVPEIGRRTVLQGLGDDHTQALGRKGVIREPRQGQPLETHLPTVAFPPLPDRRKVIAEAMEDGLDLVEVAMDAVHGVILADVFPEVEEALRHDLETQLLQDLAADGIPQGLTVILAAAGQDKELALFGPDPNRQDLFAVQDDGTGGRPDPGGCAT